MFESLPSLRIWWWIVTTKKDKCWAHVCIFKSRIETRLISVKGLEVVAKQNTVEQKSVKRTTSLMRSDQEDSKEKNRKRLATTANTQTFIPVGEHSCKIYHEFDCLKSVSIKCAWNRYGHRMGTLNARIVALKISTECRISLREERCDRSSHNTHDQFRGH